MYVCHNFWLSELQELYKKDQALIAYKRVCIRQPGSEAGIIRNMSGTITNMSEEVADSNPGWTLCIGSRLCVTAAQHFFCEYVKIGQRGDILVREN